MDWPITAAYCRTVAKALGLPIYFSWKHGGFLREMMRHDAPTAPTSFERPDGTVGTVGGRGPDGTRLRFPQVSADLSVRWCSAYLKIDVMAAAIRNQSRFDGRRTLVLTGERAQESAARARYAVFEPHKSDPRFSSKGLVSTGKRHVDVWRAVHGWTEAQVWAAIQGLGIVAHPAYRLGWPRLSCRTCIFGSKNQWATIEAVYSAVFDMLVEREDALGVTINRTGSGKAARPHGLRAIAAMGTPYAAALAQPALAALAQRDEWDGSPVLIAPDAWTLPAGAFGEAAGPC